jgi:hypothetical protein
MVPCPSLRRSTLARTRCSRGLDQLRIGFVFHVTFFKNFEGAAPAAIPPLPPIVCGRRVPMPQVAMRAKPTANSWELLVKWAGRALAEAS